MNTHVCRGSILEGSSQTGFSVSDRVTEAVWPPEVPHSKTETLVEMAESVADDEASSTALMAAPAASPSESAGE